MPYAPAEFNEAPSARTLNSVESAASNNMMNEVQNYQEQKRGANIIGTAETLTGDEAVKKMFNGKEVEKILKDFVINEDPNGGIKKITKDSNQEQGGLKPIKRENPATGSLKDHLGDCLLPPKGPKNIKEFQPNSDGSEGEPKKGSVTDRTEFLKDFMEGFKVGAGR